MENFKDDFKKIWKIPKCVWNGGNVIENSRNREKCCYVI